MFSSRAISLETCFIFFSTLSVGKAGGEKEAMPGGVTDRRDFLDVREGVLYGVPAGVGSDATAALLSSFSVSQTAIVWSVHTSPWSTPWVG
jgi:hypothetical protein